MKFTPSTIMDFFQSKTKSASSEAFTNYINSRSAREKIMIIILSAAFVLVADYFILIRPVQMASNRNWPELESLQRNIQGLKTDERNKELLQKNWQVTKENLEAKEAGFIEANGVPRLLENLSKLAMESGVKIVSLKPIELKKAGKNDRLGLYSRVPIKINALAGTHELGAFLARLESGATYFRVDKLTIQANPAEPRKHAVELDLDAYRKE